MDEPKSLFDDIDEEAEARAIEEAEADVEAGRLISHAEVIEWINSLGTENELPRPVPRKR